MRLSTVFIYLNVCNGAIRRFPQNQKSVLCAALVADVAIFSSFVQVRRVENYYVSPLFGTDPVCIHSNIKLRYLREYTHPYLVLQPYIRHAGAFVRVFILSVRNRQRDL